jgi:hypothetical protein
MKNWQHFSLKYNNHLNCNYLLFFDKISPPLDFGMETLIRDSFVLRGDLYGYVTDPADRSWNQQDSECVQTRLLARLTTDIERTGCTIKDMFNPKKVKKFRSVFCAAIVLIM